jgi:hypothetical protein
MEEVELSERHYRGQEAADYCTRRGLPITAATLAKFRCIGGGPVFQKWSRFPVYTEGALEAWIQQRLGKPVRSTSELAGNAA